MAANRRKGGGIRGGPGQIPEIVGKEAGQRHLALVREQPEVALDRAGPEHQRLAKHAGQWITTSRLITSADESKFLTSGEAAIRPILGGRFMLEENTGSMLGETFNGLRITGYNTHSRKYEGSWTYSQDTVIMTLTGTSGDEGKTIQWAGMMDMGAPYPVSLVQREIDDHSFAVEVLNKDAQGKVISIYQTLYTRKGK